MFWQILFIFVLLGSNIDIEAAPPGWYHLSTLNGMLRPNYNNVQKHPNWSKSHWSHDGNNWYLSRRPNIRPTMGRSG
uniref:Uncharacterized protein n=1 Tax=Acrobeloides nanus TaxID=290746 RepID=A0A914DDC7_9BILA